MSNILTVTSVARTARPEAVGILPAGFKNLASLFPDRRQLTSSKHGGDQETVNESFGGAERDRTVDPLLAKQVLSQLSYSPTFGCLRQSMVGLGRFELPTSPLSGVRSNQLSYRPKPGNSSWPAPPPGITPAAPTKPHSVLKRVSRTKVEHAGQLRRP